MGGGIFLIQPDESLVEMSEAPYDTEALLQDLLAKYPRLLAGDQIHSTSPRRWLLLRKEMTVPGEAGGSGRWSLDHLFVDQDGVPTLVEVKRSSDTRARREVVAQMLDYAANGVVYWPVDLIVSQFHQECEREDINPAERLREFLNEGDDPEHFWKLVETNLQAGRIRMIFVADVIPPELLRIVEFLNQQMSPADVLAVEIKQYVSGADFKTYVPRLIGQTAEAQMKKGVAVQARSGDEGSFFAEYADKQPDLLAVCRRFHDLVLPRAEKVDYTKGKTASNFIPRFTDKQGRQTLFNWSTNSKVGVNFNAIKKSSAFRDEAKRRDLLGRLKQVPGLEMSSEKVDGEPNFELRSVVAAGGVEALEKVIDWAIRQVEESRSSDLNLP